MQETNPDIRTTLYKEMDAYMMQQSPVIVLYYDKVLRLTRNEVQGLDINSMNLLTLKQVRKTTAEELILPVGDEEISISSSVII